jgi:transcriptional regulator with XRE-family HTH domain
MLEYSYRIKNNIYNAYFNQEGDEMSISEERRLSMYTSEELGKAIQKKRKEKKISQKVFAEMLGKSERTIQKYESGEIAIKVDVLKQIANELDVPWYELLDAQTPQVGIITSEDDKYKYQFHTMADVINALFTLTKIKYLSFSLSISKPPENPEWITSISVNGKDEGKYNADFCLFMENWMNKLQQLKDGFITENQFEIWKTETLAYYSDGYFSDVLSQSLKGSKENGTLKKESSFKVIHLASINEDKDNTDE